MAGAVAAAALFDGERLRHDVALAHEGGGVAAIERLGEPPRGPRRLVTPALVNAHDHARPLSTTSFGSAFLPLEAWLPRNVFVTPPDPYLAAIAPLARAARAGCGAVMVHYTRPSGTLSPVDEARSIARAANDIGVRIAFAPAVRDMNPLVYGDETEMLARLPPATEALFREAFVREPTTPQAYLDLVDEIADAIAGPLVDVQYGPAGPQWCSRPMLEAIADASARTGRRVHMHLLETERQRAWADRAFPDGVVRHLEEIGLLSERLTLAHCVHARPDELDRIAASGARIVTNFSSNMYLRSGLGPIRQAHARGCRVAVGVDGQALDEDDDLLREMRLVHGVHAGAKLDPAWTRAGFLSAVIAAGRAAVGAPGDGALTPGAPADFVTFDLDALDRDRIAPVDPLDLLFTRGAAAHVREVVVAGRTIVADGRVTGVDLDAVEAELRTLFRANAGRHRALEAAWGPFDAGLRDWFRGCLGCG
ncbi:amidohydrolase family protein [Methylopila henanensis]|uniref:Amidohydrolase family protein n=1 Tax=Methylopila henanensis TaxID=873516 RepID=A0ABW4K7E5_9HYPH